MQQRKLSPERLLYKFKTITQIPNFRIGWIVKIIQLMNAEMGGLIDHVSSAEQKRDPLKKMTIYKGCTKIWDLP